MSDETIVNGPAVAGSDEQGNVSSEPLVNFPKIQRHVFDVLHDDERHEVWIGVKLRTPAKAKFTEDGPIEDIEMSFDAVSILVSLDAAKQEVLMALSKDSKMLQEHLQRRQSLNKSGILSRVNHSVGKIFDRAKSLIH